MHEVLTNEKYIGNNVYHRTSFKLKRKHVVNPPEEWIRADGVFEGIIEPESIFRVRAIILARSQRLSGRGNAGEAARGAKATRAHQRDDH